MASTWVPYSGVGLVAGAAALAAGALLTPVTSDADPTRVSDLADSRYLVVASMYFVAACALTLGLPSILTLFRRRNRLGMVAVGVFVIGCLGIAGYAMLLVFVRAMAVTGSAATDDLSNVADEAGLLGFLYGWVAAFYLGELLLAIALLRATTTPRWIPALLLAHVALAPVSSMLPPEVSGATALLVTVGLAGVGVCAVAQDRRQPTRSDPSLIWG
jgi:hypothetical protein